jgi:hypothetical protein
MSKGFHYMGKMYVWHKGELYRLPYCVNLKWYKQIKCKKWLDKGYYLGSVKKSFLQLKEMTVDVNESIETRIHKDTPF